MGARMRDLDWSNTPLGRVDRWPQSLRSTVSMLLPSKAQIVLFWGPEYCVLYNDAYRPVFGAKHPLALGLPGREAWSEIWDSMLHGLLAGVVRTGEAFWAKDTAVRGRAPRISRRDLLRRFLRPGARGVGRGRRCVLHRDRNDGARGGSAADGPVEGPGRPECDRAHCPRRLRARHGDPRCQAAGRHVRPHVPGRRSPELYSWSAATAGGTSARARRRSSPSLRRARGVPAVAWLLASIRGARTTTNTAHSWTSVADQLGTALANARAYEQERRRAEALAEVDRAKTTFFSNVSHEFRTPLTLLVGPLEDGLADVQTPLPPVHRDRQEIAHRNALRLLRLVNTLLDFSRIEAGRIDANYEPTDLAQFTAELASVFRSAVEKAGLALVVNCDPLPEPVYVDRDMWEKILLNLLSNAFKFTFDGQITVELRGLGDQVELRVADTGVGIPETELPRMFERFHRVRHGTRQDTRGHGYRAGARAENWRDSMAAV